METSPSEAPRKFTSAVKSVRVRCVGATGLKTGGWFLRLRSISHWLNTSTAHFSGSPVWDESFVVEILRHMELELWEHDPVEGDKIASKKTVNITLDVFPEAEPPVGVETVKTFLMPNLGSIQLGFTLLPPGTPASGPAQAPLPASVQRPQSPEMSKKDKRKSIIGERRAIVRPEPTPQLEAEDAIMEQLRQVNERLIAMGKKPLTKSEAALIMAGKRRETLVIPKGASASSLAAMQKGGSTIVPHDGSNSNGAGSASPQETKWMSKRTSLAPRRDSGTVIYSQFKQQIHLKDREITEKEKNIEKLQNDVKHLQQEIEEQKAVIASLEEKSSGLANQLKTKSMQFLLVFEKIKEEKSALHNVNVRLEEELKEKQREHEETIKRMTADYEEKIRLAYEEGCLSTTISYTIKLENEKTNHSRELARVKSDSAFEEEQLRKKAEFEKQALIQQYEGLLKKEREHWAETMRKQKEKSREKKQRLREERSQKEGVTQEMRLLQEKMLNDKRKWEEERENAKKALAERESQLERESRENQRLTERTDGLEERIALLEKKLQQAEQEKQSLVSDFAEQQESARKVTEVQLKRIREESAGVKERLEQEIETLKQKLQQATDREQISIERERKEKLELKEAKVQLESERLELSERVQQLLSVDKEFKTLRERFQALQKEVEDEKRERKFLNTEKEQLQLELTRVQQEAEANLKAAQAAAIPAAPAAPAAPIAPSSPSVQRRDSDDGESEDVGGLLAAITKGVSLQPVKVDNSKKPRPKAEGEIESITEAIAIAIARRREMMMLAPSGSSNVHSAAHDEDILWDPDLAE